MAKIINIHEAKTHFSKLLTRVRAGEEIIIAKAGKPVARLIPIGQISKNRIPGSAKSKVVVAEDFDAPLSESILNTFEK
jgi:prevent-host-death family protein